MELEMYTCVECGHLHFLGADKGYADCPIEGCDCKGQSWALTPEDITAEMARDAVLRPTDLSDAILRLAVDRAQSDPEFMTELRKVAQDGIKECMELHSYAMTDEEIAEKTNIPLWLVQRYLDGES